MEYNSERTTDSSYPESCLLLNWVMKPYKENGASKIKKRGFNKKLIQARVFIDHIFGLLKPRYRILNYMNAISIEKTVKKKVF